MPKGGKRPGAGPPRGNVNALKTGRYSRQFRDLVAYLASHPGSRRILFALARAERRKRRRAARTKRSVDGPSADSETECFFAKL